MYIIRIAIDFGSDEESGVVLKRAAAAHNIMRFGRGGHNIMHFGKRTLPQTYLREDNTLSDESAPDLSDSSYSNGEPESYSYDPNPFSVLRRSPKTRYFIPHAFIGLYLISQLLI